jgi:hypothetical protein
MLVDLDDPETWPELVRVRAEQWDDAGLTTTEAAEAEAEFSSLLAGSQLLAYHAPRLLPHEEEAIKHEGLQPVSATLTRQRLRLARENGYLTESAEDELQRLAPFLNESDIDRPWREGRGRGIFLMIGRGPLEDGLCPIAEWLGIWGGPSLYESIPGFPQESELLTLLRSLGRPVIFKAKLEFRSEHFQQPGAARFRSMFSDALKTPGFGCEVCYCAPLPTENIVALCPGDAEYDGLGDLPRS